MTQLIQPTKWNDFFDKISRSCQDWETSVQIINDISGAQVLSEGLPFNGITYDDSHGKNIVEIDIGTETDNHQTHNIIDPQAVAFEPAGNGPGGTMDIEDASGTKTLINFIQPMPLLVQYVKSEILTVN